MNHARKPRQSGFTLLEAIVTLVVVSMLMAMLMQALSQSLGLRTRLLRLQGESRQMLLQEAWLRENLATAQPPVTGEGDFFEGNASSVTFISAMPLVAQGSARVRWWLAPDAAGDLTLWYSDPAVAQLAVIKGPLHDAVFSYGTDDAQWQPQWHGQAPSREPVRGSEALAATDEPPSPPILPRLLRFRATTSQGRQLDWVVHLPADLRAAEQGSVFSEVIGGN